MSLIPAELATPPPEFEDEPASPTASSISVADDEIACMSRSQAYNLYTSHLLSTWNIRTYEFAAIIFTAAAYPDTLVAAAIRGIVRTVASICFSSVVGRWVDQTPDRLQTLLSTISVNRFAVIGASVLWYFIVDPEPGSGSISNYGSSLAGYTFSEILKGVVFSLILLLGILEALSGSGNMLSMERDWVVTASSPDGKAYDLTHMNAVMRRIDLICKLIAPILISIVISATNTRIGVVVVGGMSAVCWGVEVLCARRVWNQNPRLKAPKLIVETQGDEVVTVQENTIGFMLERTAQSLKGLFQDFRNYFSSTVWIPSLSLAFLHLSALSYGATFITFLLSAGFSLDLITFARAAGSVVEISSTVVTPFGVHYLGKARNHGRFRGEERESEESASALLEGLPEEEAKTETGLERLGLWGITWQLINLIPVIFALWSLSLESAPSVFRDLASRIFRPISSQPMLAFTLFFFLSISRLGLWIYDLTTQQLTQTMTIPSQRSSFTGVEYSFVNVFELAQFLVTIIFHRPEQFKWIALMSWVAVAISTMAYAAWVWRMRGHLVHWEKLGKGCECGSVRNGHRSWRRRMGDSFAQRLG